MPFQEVLASVDMVVTKPGYGTIVEAVALRRPVVYVRRYSFADEQSLVDYLHRYGRGTELSQADFFAGRWEPAIQAAFDQAVPPPPPSLSGAVEAAELLSRYF
jgi:UDP-N-acetylglucosamine:LPS N-acetylglucosamine transferase